MIPFRTPMFFKPADAAPGLVMATDWRLYFPLNSYDGSYVGITEVELMDAGGVDLTSPAQAVARASASDFQVGGTEGHQAFDDVLTNGGAGNYNFWQANGGAGKWLRWNFASPVNISRVRIYPDIDGINRSPTVTFVQYWDGAQWVTYWGFSLVYWTLQWFDVTRAGRLLTPIDFHFGANFTFGAGTGRNGFDAAVLGMLGNVNSFKLGFKAVAGALTIHKCRVGKRDTSVGHYAQFLASPTPVYATFGGVQSSGSKAAGTRFDTDTINFPFNAATEPLEVAIYFTGNLGFQEKMKGAIFCYRGGVDDVASNAANFYTYPWGDQLIFVDKFTKVS